MVHPNDGILLFNNNDYYTLKLIDLFSSLLIDIIHLEIIKRLGTWLKI